MIGILPECYRIWIKGNPRGGCQGTYHAYPKATLYPTTYKDRPLYHATSDMSALCGYEAHGFGVAHLTEDAPPGEGHDARCEMCMRSLLLGELAR